MTQVVMDTNVIVSAALAKNPAASIPFALVRMALVGAIQPVVSKAIFKEYREVLNRKKFNLDKKFVNEFLAAFKSKSLLIEPPRFDIILPDVKDAPFYDAAKSLESNGALLVTGNKRHFPNCPFAATPREFMARLNAR